MPLRELRKLAGLASEDDEETVAEFAELWAEAGRQARGHADGTEADRADGIRQTRFLLEQVQFGFRTKPSQDRDEHRVSPLSGIDSIKPERNQHL